MDWEFLHGNSHETYITLKNSIPADLRSMIPAATERLLDYGVHGDPRHYSMLALETSDGPVLLRSLCARKRNAYSASYYVHKQVMSCTPREMLERFEDILALPFYSEEEFDRIAEGERDVQPTARWQAQEVRIHKEVLRAVLRGMIRRWRSGNEPVVVEVPGDADYDSYCMGAIRKIYSYLPAGIRAKAGFMTYTIPGSITNHMVLVFQPAGAVSNAIRLDRENEQSQAFLDAGLPANWSNMINKLVDSTPQERRQFLEELCKWAETEPGTDRFVSNLSGTHYISYLENKDVLQETRTQEGFDELLKHCQNNESLSGQMWKQVRNQLDKLVPDAAFWNFALNLKDSDANFQLYAERLAKLYPMVRYSRRMTDSAKKALVDGFHAALSSANKLEEMRDLQIQLKNVENGKHPWLTAEDFSDFRKALSQKMEEPLRELVWQGCQATRTKYREEAKACTNLQAWDTLWEEHSKKLKENLALLEINSDDEWEKLQKEHDDERKRWIKDFCDAQMYGHIDEKTYNTKCNQLDSLHRYLSGKGDRLAYMPVDARNKLEDKYNNIGFAAEAKLNEALSAPDYFDAVQKAQRCFLEDPEHLAKKEKETHKTLSQKRPYQNVDQYCSAFQKAYKKQLNACAFIGMEGFAAEQIIRDWGELCVNTPIELEKKSLLEVRDEVRKRKSTCEMLDQTMEDIRLRCNDVTTVYPCDRLCNTLEAFVAGAGIADRLKADDTKQLLRQIGDMDLPEKAQIRVLEALVDSRADEELVKYALYYVIGERDKVMNLEVEKVLRQKYKNLLHCSMRDLEAEIKPPSGINLDGNRSFGNINWKYLQIPIVVVLLIALVALVTWVVKTAASDPRDPLPIQTEEPTEYQSEDNDRYDVPWIDQTEESTVFEKEENGGDDVTQPDQSEEPVASENENIDDDDTVPLDQTEEPTASDSEDNSIDDVTQLDQTEEPSAFESEADWG